MEVNAAAAMAKFKSFRAPTAVKETKEEVPLVATSSPAEVDASDMVAMDPATEAAVAEACAGNKLWQSSVQPEKASTPSTLRTNHLVLLEVKTCDWAKLPFFYFSLPSS